MGALKFFADAPRAGPTTTFTLNRGAGDVGW
jgi:hypothetical protein